jgi:hypothetical protein
MTDPFDFSAFGDDMQPWKSLTKAEDIEVIAPDGKVRCQVKGYYAGTQFAIDDMRADVQVGDEIRRILPNGNDDVFLVVDPKFYTGAFGPHYQIKITRKGAFSPHTGGHYVHVTGANSRVNVNSTDNSTNITTRGSVFNEIRKAVRRDISDDAVRSEIERQIVGLENAKNKIDFTTGLQGLMADAGKFVSVLSPFLAGLTQVLANLPS